MEIEAEKKREKTGGRQIGTPNKSTAFIRELAGEHAERAIEVLVEVMEAEDTPAAAKVSASKELIERGFGRSGNFIKLDLDTSLSAMPPVEAMAIVSDKLADGKISVEEGLKLISIIEARIKAVELAEIEKRLCELEGAKR